MQQLLKPLFASLLQSDVGFTRRESQGNTALASFGRDDHNPHSQHRIISLLVERGLVMLFLFKLVAVLLTLVSMVSKVSMVVGIKTIGSTNNFCPAKKLAVYQLQLHTFWSEQVTGFDNDIHFYEVIRDQSYLVIFNITIWRREGYCTIHFFHQLIWSRCW